MKVKLSFLILQNTFVSIQVLKPFLSSVFLVFIIRIFSAWLETKISYLRSFIDYKANKNCFHPFYALVPKHNATGAAISN